jgi:hypothetical protein
MEYFYFLILCAFWPVKMIFVYFHSKKDLKNRTPLLPDAVCRKIILKNTNNGLLWASSQDYTDMWTRDTFFACFGNPKLQKRMAKKLAAYQRDDGLIPLYIGAGDAFRKMYCGQRADGEPEAHYKDAKTGDEPTDSCFQFIIMAYHDYPQKCKQAWQYMQKYVINGLVMENGLGTWQDTIKHSGHVTYTNMLYYQATKCVYPEKCAAIKQKIIQTLWNGKYFVSSTSNGSFGQVDNALALIYEIAPNPSSIFNIHKAHFDSPFSPPNKMIEDGSKAFGITEVYLPCYPIGNADYHNGWAWSWVNLLFIKAKLMYKKRVNIEYYESMLKDYGTLYETYDENGPIQCLLYKSQPNFSESCGLFLDVYKKSKGGFLSF